MLDKLAIVGRRGLNVMLNPYLSGRGKLRCLAEKPWQWSRVQLCGGWMLDLATAEDRDTFADVFFLERYRPLPYAGATVVDIGGHKGYFALYALLRGAARVIVLECEPDNATAIERMLHANALGERVRLIRKAAWDETGELTLNLTDDNWAHSLVRGDGARSVVVEATTLGAVVEGASGSGRVVVKSNCEGAETRIFGDVPARVSDMIISYHAWAPEPLTSLAGRLASQGFAVRVLARNAEHTELLCQRQPQGAVNRA